MKERILFFVAGMVPTQDELAQAADIGKPVSFRNVSLYNPEHALEECNAVAGLVPEAYAEKHPNAFVYVEHKQIEQQEKAAIIGDSKAPSIEMGVAAFVEKNKPEAVEPWPGKKKG